MVLCIQFCICPCFCDSSELQKQSFLWADLGLWKIPGLIHGHVLEISRPSCINVAAKAALLATMPLVSRAKYLLQDEETLLFRSQQVAKQDQLYQQTLDLPQDRARTCCRSVNCHETTRTALFIFFIPFFSICSLPFLFFHTKHRHSHRHSHRHIRYTKLSSLPGPYHHQPQYAQDEASLRSTAYYQPV